MTAEKVDWTTLGCVVRAEPSPILTNASFTRMRLTPADGTRHSVGRAAVVLNRERHEEDSTP